MSIEARLGKIENILEPRDKTIHVAWGNPDEPGVYRLGKSDEKTGPPMTEAEIREVISSGTVIFVNYEQRETMRGLD